VRVAAQSFRCVSRDPLAHGHSPTPDQPYSQAGLAADRVDLRTEPMTLPHRRHANLREAPDQVAPVLE